MKDGYRILYGKHITALPNVHVWDPMNFRLTRNLDGSSYVFWVSTTLGRRLENRRVLDDDHQYAPTVGALRITNIMVAYS